jgi:hypothetical protein
MCFVSHHLRNEQPLKVILNSLLENRGYEEICKSQVFKDFKI